VPNAYTSRFVTGNLGPTKDVMYGVNKSMYTGWVAPFADVHDPNFSDFVNRYVSLHAASYASYWSSPYTIGFTADDRDDLFGFAAGPEIRANTHPHLGWLILVTNFQQSSNSTLNPPQTYNDRKVYSKYALRDQLVAKYGTIAALNAAWGSSYTTFDSAGGWGTGTGLLDEDGHHAWVPRDYDALTGASAAMVIDLDNCLLEWARTYFRITSSAIRQSSPSNALLFGPPAVNSEGVTRKQILQAAGEYVDVLNAVIMSQTALEKTAQYFGDKPIVAYELTAANPDSALFRYPNVAVDPNRWFTTQAARGTGYSTLLSTHLNQITTNGIYPIAGIKIWEFHDNWPEKGGWGLVSLSDNAYDGKEAIIATGTDPWGYRTGGEERNYGDVLTQVVTANAGVAAAIGALPSDTPTSTSVSITSPTSGSTVKQTVTVAAKASSSATRIDLALDGAVVGIFGGTAATYPWDTSATPDGRHQWVAKAFDVSGASVTSSPVDVVVRNASTSDTTAPVVSITQPANGSSVPRRRNVTLEATASDNVAVTRVEFYVDGNRKCSVTVAPYACSWQVPAAKGRTYRLQAKGYDAQGNMGSSSIVSVQAQ
jgi:hypothetical protein